METNNAIQKLEADLATSSQKIHDLIKSCGKGFDMAGYYAEKEENLRLQRELFLAKNEETALRLDWDAPWDTGAPLPHVFSSGHKTILIYYLRVANPKWDGTDCNAFDPLEDIAFVEFIRCYEFKFGGLNEETLKRHSLWGKGLEQYEAHKIENSKWISEYKKSNPEFDNKNRNHYMLTFHDETFECIAEGYKITIIHDPLISVANEAIKCLVKQ